ncbi:MAG TPA: MASE1 domain-containing protein [Gemmatimonadaceae bacterium]|nr:MASE1 domain-containing protein [Gemmatimonadaceae bacterium]
MKQVNETLLESPAGLKFDTSRPRYALAIIGLALVYFVAARAGLMMDAVAGFATLVWPPTGLALAALLLFGTRLWPGVFIGAVVANLLTGAPVPVALGIGLGNTLEAVLAVYALRRIPGFQVSLERLVDVIGLIVLAAGLSTMVSATIGVISLYLGGIISSAQLAETWRAWWLGDLIADLLVAPVLLVWGSGPRKLGDPKRRLEAVALGISVIVASLLIFGGPAGPATATGKFAQAYMFFPLLIWAALRFGQRGAVFTAFIVSVIAIWGTALGHGPFVRPALYQSLIALQTFMGIAAATFLVLGASISERQRAEREMELAHARAKQANQAKAEFLAVMSHELRTPLNAISGYVDILSLGVDGPLSDKQLVSLSRIQLNQQHLLSLIDDVLSFAKIEAGRLEIHVQTVLVHDVLESLEAVIRPELLRKDLDFTSDCDDRLSVRADPEKLRQILLNFLANAIKFTPEGGRIRLGADHGQELVRIWVSDTGIGIPAEQIEQVFEPFFQVETGPTRRYPGIGLGLAIARDLARAMDGEVRLESIVGKGSTVSVLLPPG